jgi:hypothetical protein
LDASDAIRPAEPLLETPPDRYCNFSIRRPPLQMIPVRHLIHCCFNLTCSSNTFRVRSAMKTGSEINPGQRMLNIVIRVVHHK